MTDYLRTKWLHLRMYRTKASFMLDYKTLRNTAKLMGARNERTRA